jgi:hypothetical protein
MSVLLEVFRISIEPGMPFKILEIEHLIGEVWLDKNVDIQVDVTEHLAVKLGRHVDIAVEAFQLMARLTETKNVVPTIHPVKLSAQGPRLDFAQKVVLDVLIKFAIENEQRKFILNYPRFPTPMFDAVVLFGAD